METTNQAEPRATAASLKIELDAANKAVKKLLNQSMRSGRGPSPEYKAAYLKARLIWRKWSDALDIEAGRKPAFATSTGDR
jgi:hypothetical protein